jgi:uncharacterized membrane protein
MIRPLIAPMAEGAAASRFRQLDDTMRYRIRAFAAATDNVGLFFGEDIFVAFGAIVLMVTFLKEAGISVQPLHVAVWGMPTALAAFIVHGFRLYRLDGWLARRVQLTASSKPANKTPGSAGQLASAHTPVQGDKV